MKNSARITSDGREQPLADHLKTVARLTSDSLPESLKRVGYYTGLWHDLGKYIPQWQRYLRGEAKKKPHSPQGAMFALMQCPDRDKIPAIAFAIAGHHTGLQNRTRLGLQDFEESAKDWQESRDIACCELDNLIPETFPDINLPPLRREFAIRMLFSALVDADRLDAMNFEQKRRNPCLAEVSLPYSFNPRSLPDATTDIARLRNGFAEDCIATAEGKKGLYRLTGACGIGKTETSLRWAILHARYHQMKGILYVGPLEVIIEQTARVYRNLLGEENVLEHHSSYEPRSEEIRNYQLDTERWDKPYIVTSGVQFYESLFANKPGKCRKLHNISNRVILIDEAQTIPLHLAIPILDVLETLIEDWGCTIVLMSATQPAFDRLELCHNAVDIISIEQVKQQLQALKRVTYRTVLDTPWNWENLAEDIQASGCQQTLTVVNTTALAREGYEALDALVSSNWYHLSARMCPAHRWEVLETILQQLSNNRPCHLISTQLIEAGVDIDFPRVYRQLSPFDSIIQTAGRCNRNGKLAVSDATREADPCGIATIFKLQNAPSPAGDYTFRTQLTESILASYPNALDGDMLNAIQKYFQSLYNRLRSGGQEIQKARHCYDYPQVAELFRVIDDDKTQSVVVPWCKGKVLIEELQSQEFLTQADWRQIQPYCATVPRSAKTVKQLDNGLIIWTGNYDCNVGCVDA